MHEIPANMEVLIVEDEALVALNLESMLEELGCRIIGPIMRLDRALTAVGEGLVPQAAILDVNLGGERVFPLAHMLATAKVPIVFATGYGRDGLPDEWRDTPVVQKPYTLEQVSVALAEALRAQVG